MRRKEDPPRQQLDRLGSVALSLEERYVVNGKVLGCPIKFTIANKLDECPLVVDFPTKLNDSKLESMCKLAKPSAFGHGKETVFDENVRRASELLPDQFTVEGFDPSPFLKQYEKP